MSNLPLAQSMMNDFMSVISQLQMSEAESNPPEKQNVPTPEKQNLSISKGDKVNYRVEFVNPVSWLIYLEYTTDVGF
jgi:hypothetical protein